MEGPVRRLGPVGAVLAFCLARAALSAAGPLAGHWPFFTYAMYSGYGTAGIARGVPLFGLRPANCRLPTPDFGSRTRLDVGNLFRIADSAALLRELRGLCARDGLPVGDCTKARFVVYWAELARSPQGRYSVSGYEVDERGITPLGEKRLLDDPGSLFPGGSCGPGA